MKRKSFVMTLSISALVILLGVSSCTKRKNPSSIVPSSETSISESISNSTSEAESTVGTSDSTSSEDSSTSEATSEQPSSEAVSSDEPSSEPSSEVVSSEEPSSEPSSEVVSSEEPSSEPSSEVVSSEDSNDTSSDSGSSEVNVKSTIKIGTANPVEMEEVDTDPLFPTQVAQYKYVADVHAGDVLVFTHAGEIVTKIGEDKGNNNLKSVNGSLVVINDATQASIYLKAWNDGGYSVWVEGYQAPVVEVGYTVELNGNAVDKANLGEVALDGNQFAFSIDLAVDDVVVIKNNNTAVGESFTCEIAGTHIFYVKDGVVYPVAPHQAKVTIGGAEAVVMEETVKGEEDTWEEQYKFTATSLTAGQELVFTYNGKAISTNIGTEGEGNNVALKEGKLLVVNDAENANIYFKVWKSGYSVWVEGYQAPVVEVGYTVELNGHVVDKADLGEVALDGNQFAFSLDLVVDDVVVIKNNNTAVGESFTCEIAGTHIFYVKDGVVYPVAPHHAKVTVGEAEAVLMEATVKGAEDEWVEQYKFTATNLTAGQKLVFTYNGTEIKGNIGAGDMWKGNNVICDSKTGVFSVLTTKEEAEIYFKVYESGYSVWVSGFENVFTLEADGENKIIKSISAGETNLYAFTVDLEASSTITIKNNGIELTIGDTSETTLTVIYSGTHTVYVNKSRQVYVTNPSCKIKVGEGEVEMLSSPKEVTLAIDDKVYIYCGTTLLKEFTATKEGKHTFKVKDDYTVSVIEPDDPVVEVGYKVLVNGAAVEESSLGKLELGDNAKAFTITLEVGHKLVVKNNGTALTIGEGPGTEFVCTVAGTHKVYVNKSGQVYVTSPLAPVTTVYTVTVNGENTAITLIPDEENHAKFKLTLKAGDKVVVLGDGKALEGGAYTGTEYTVKVAGEHTFFVNAQDKVYMDAPAEPVQVGYTVTVDGALVEESSLGKLELGDNAKAFTITLEVGHKLVVKNNGTALTIGEGPGTEFVCTVAGTHKVYVNKSGQVYVTSPLAPVTTVYTVTVNGENTAITLIPDEENHAKFKLTLKAGDKVVVLGDGKALEGGAYTGTEYTVKVAGEHTFFVNAQDKVYMDAPAPDPSDVTAVTLTFDFSALARNDERYAVYLCGGPNSEWVSLEDNNDVCTLTLTKEQVAKYTTIIFCRMDGSALENNWDNRWNQTEDLMIEGNDGKTYKIISWGTGNKVNGSWN